MPEQKPSSPSPKSGPRPIDEQEVSGQGCTLGREVHFDGTLNANEDLIVLGRVNGKINAQGALIIGREAQVDATINGQKILVHGRVKGDITGAERVELGPSANVDGDISAPVIQINEGAQFQGHVRRSSKGGGGFLDRMLGS